MWLIVIKKEEKKLKTWNNFWYGTPDGALIFLGGG